MATTVHPLRLLRHHFDRIQVEALPDREKESKTQAKAHLVYGAHSTEERRARLQMQIDFEPAPESKAGYRGSVQAIGYFEVTEPSSSDAVRKLVTTSGADMLFGAIREMICNLTARGPWPMLRLQSIVFCDIAESGKRITKEDDPAAPLEKSSAKKLPSRKSLRK